MSPYLPPKRCEPVDKTMLTEERAHVIAGATGMTAYECEHGEHWHVGHRGKSRVARQRRAARRAALAQRKEAPQDSP